MGAEHRRHDRNDAFFATFSPEVCYWAGLIAADGYIEERRRYVTLAMHTSDENHLVKFCAAVGYSGPIYHRPTKQMSTVTIWSDQMVADLRERFNITQAKSLTLTPPQLTGDAALAFSKGYVDGDGSVGYYLLNNHREVLSIEAAGTHALLSWLLITWRTTVDHSGARAYRWGTPSKVKGGNIYKIIVRDKRAERIRAALNNLPIDGLARKWGAKSRHHAVTSSALYVNQQ